MIVNTYFSFDVIRKQTEDEWRVAMMNWRVVQIGFTIVRLITKEAMSNVFYDIYVIRGIFPWIQSYIFRPYTSAGT